MIVRVQAKAAEPSPASAAASTRTGSGEIRVTSVEVLDEAGSHAPVLMAGQPCTFRLHYQAQVALDGLTFGLGFVHESRAVVSSPTSARTGPCSVASGDGYVDFRVPELFLQAGSYEVSTTIADRGHVYDHTSEGARASRARPTG